MSTQPARSFRTRITRYGAGSVVATVASQVTFTALYGLGWAGPQWASVLAWLAGAIPNYVLNRRWAWGRRGRADLWRETLPYVVIVIGSAVASALTTSAADALTDDLSSDLLRVGLVAAVFLATNGIMFVVKFVLFDRLIFPFRATTS